jgi:menaquinone-dependent protoporphyrinogen IX oxidase
MSNERKKELLNTIVSYLSQTGEVILNDATIQNHLTNFLKLHKKDEDEIIRQFLKAYCSVLRASKMPFFSLNWMIESYKRWKINKDIFKYLLKLSKRIDRQNLTSDFCAYIVLKPQVALFEGED